MKKLLLISGIILVGIGGTVYYYWQQFNYVPSANNSSLTQLQNNPDNLVNLQQKKAEIDKKINQDLPKQQQVEINLTEDNINTVIGNEINKHPQISPGVKSVNTNINKEQIETGMVINLSQIPTDKLSESDKNSLNKITQTFPMIANRDVYIAIVGKPTIENGNLKLNENTQVKIGNFTFKISDIATQLGMDKDKLKKELTIPLKSDKFKIDSLQLQDNQINLSVISK